MIRSGKNSFSKINSKKGVSPLVATVLLIAFAVALGSIVMSWGRNYVEDAQTFAGERSNIQYECATVVDFSINRIIFDSDLNEVKITVENNAETEISGFVVKLLEPSGEGVSLLINQSLGPFAIKSMMMRVSEEMMVDRVKLVPEIIREDLGIEQYCNDRLKEMGSEHKNFEVR